MRWVGIDEAGYGPNLGPLVMTAVVAEAAGPGGRHGRMRRRTWISGAIWRARWIGRAAIRAGSGWTIRRRSCAAARGGIDWRRPAWPRCTRPGWGCRVRCGIAGGDQGRDARGCRALPLVRRGRSGVGLAMGLCARRGRGIAGATDARAGRGGWRSRRSNRSWSGPARFNAGLDATGSKAEVHFAAFARLLRQAWDRASDGARRS